MKAILISIQPQWVEKILNGEKTIEIRKTMPKCELPCKAYIYCTKGKGDNWTPLLSDTDYKHAFGYRMNGLVVAEFTLKEVECFTTDYRKNVYQTKRISECSCVTFHDLVEYEYGSPCLYAWHIDNLKIYDTPKELSEFGAYCNGEDLYKCFGCEYYCVDTSEYETYEQCCCNNIKPLRRPPQSWCYVEEN